MAQENQRFKFKVKFYGWKSDKSWMSERKCKCLSQKSPEIRPTTIRCRRWLGETKVNVQYLQRCYKLQHIKEQVCIFGVRFEIPMIGNSLTGMELWNLLFDDTNINNTGIVKCTKKKESKDYVQIYVQCVHNNFQCLIQIIYYLHWKIEKINACRGSGQLNKSTISDLVTVELLHVYVDGNKIKDFNLIKWKKCKENKINLQLNRISKSN